MSYPNGRIPLSMLEHLGGDHYLPAGTAARWRWLVQAAYEKYGVRLRITQGPNAYRWYEAQVEAKEEACARGRCQDAAAPSFSSHGGLFEGRQVMAVDVANWQDLGSTPSGKDAWGRFEALCRLAGFTVLFFDWEPWHITDFNDPWIVPEWAAPKIMKEVQDMDKIVVGCLRLGGKNQEWALLGASLPGGVRSTKSQETANAWARLYGGAFIVESRTEWETTWREARALHAAWLGQQKALRS